jgi:hypothetical protein
MSLEELNFKKLADEKHRVYRILRAGSNVAASYKHMISKIGKYRGAIIFPEQFIAMGDSYVYEVCVTRPNSDTSGVNVSRTGPFYLTDGDGKRLHTVDDVIATELADILTPSNIWGMPSIQSRFQLKNNMARAGNMNLDNLSANQLKGIESTTYWFSNKNDAMSFARSQIVIS